MTRSSSLRIPFVVTVAASAACSGSAVMDGGSGGSSSNASGSGSGGTTTSSSAQTATAVSTTSAGGSLTCPPTPPAAYLGCNAAPGTCGYDVPCQSGQVELQFQCSAGYWELVPGMCVESYDSCPGTEYYCGDGGWWMPTATNPPSPCPTAAPLEGEPCFPGGMGGVWEKCGYRCGPQPDSAWTIATCTESGMGATWIYDDACD